ncbi:hypothetical protein K8S19_13490 [bacterium]|nr:hypothetical protein [bacterium]
MEKLCLLMGGIASILIAVLHIVIIAKGPEWYRLFGAGEQMARMAEQGSWIPGLLTLMIVLVFLIWGLYAFSGAGLIKPLPLLRLGLITIASIYLVRGLVIIPFYLFKPGQIDRLIIWSSAVSLLIGSFYVFGIVKRRTRGV